MLGLGMNIIETWDKWIAPMRSDDNGRGSMDIGSGEKWLSSQRYQYFRLLLENPVIFQTKKNYSWYF